MTLPVTGTYTILFDPSGTSTGSATVTLSSQLNAGTIVIDGASVTVTTTRVGQRATLTFAGTAAQVVGLGVNSSTVSSLNMYFYKPDGTQLTWGGASTGTNFDMTLPVTGTYTILFDPNGLSTGSVTVTLSAEIDAGTITINGASATATVGRVGQRARMRFDGTAGQQVTVRNTSNTISSVTVSLLRPDGTSQTSSTSGAASFNLTTQTLATTGTYKVLINPSGTNTGSLNVNVTSP